MSRGYAASAPNKAILDAAAHCFAQNGVELTSIDDIAQRMGATKGKVYHHFGSKGELVSAVRRHSVQLTLDHVAPVYAAGGAPAVLLAAMAGAHVDVMMRALPYHRVVVETGRRDPRRVITEAEAQIMTETRTLQTRYEDLYRDLLRRGIASGDFTAPNLSVALHSLMMLLNAPVYWYRPRPEEGARDRQAIAAQIASMALGAMGARPAARSGPDSTAG